MTAPDRSRDCKTVGDRQFRHDWEDVARLQASAEALRGHRSLVPRGVYRFTSFEEADAWMTRMIASTHAHQRRRTSPASPWR